jgi:hypothetical protein
MGDDELGFLRGAVLLPAVGTALFFGGRSTGLSAASTLITSNCVPPVCNVFLPGQGKTVLLMSRFATR